MNICTFKMAPLWEAFLFSTLITTSYAMPWAAPDRMVGTANTLHVERSAAKPGQSNSDMTGLIVGCAIGGCGFVIAMSALVYALVRRRQRKLQNRRRIETPEIKEYESKRLVPCSS
jgi:hypothetical protein